MTVDHKSHPLFSHLTVRDCGQPSNLGSNGEVSVGETTFGSVANYSCNFGYRLVPENNARLCQANATWSGMDPMCQRMSLLLHTLPLLYNCILPVCSPAIISDVHTQYPHLHNTYTHVVLTLNVVFTLNVVVANL